MRMTNDIRLPKGTGLGWRMDVADKAFDLANGAAKLGSAMASAPAKSGRPSHTCNCPAELEEQRALQLERSLPSQLLPSTSMTRPW